MKTIRIGTAKEISMVRSKFFRIALLIVLIAAIFPLETQAADAIKPQGVHLRPIGHPTWRPVDIHMFSAPIGTAASGYAEFAETMQALLPPPNHQFNPSVGIIPGAAHLPPYKHELKAGVQMQGYHEGKRFSGTEFQDGMGVWLAWMVVPRPGVKGSSPDFATGPIIPNSLFPIHVTAVTYQRGKLTNPGTADFNVPPLDENFDPPFSVDGHSHFPIFIADNWDFQTGAPAFDGRYSYQITMTDSAGNGWKILARFKVTREGWEGTYP
jgi:hypothetical protein